MKNKIAIIVLIIVVVAVAAGISFYFIQKNKAPANSVENITPPSQSEVNNQTNSEQSQSKLVTDDFEISLPEGWRETAPAMGASAMAVNADEQLTDPRLKRLISEVILLVSYDTLQGKSLSEYLQSVKSQLQQTISGVIFAQEHDTTINGKPARAFEASFTQQGVNFKILMVAVKGAGDDVWVMSLTLFKTLGRNIRKHSPI